MWLALMIVPLIGFVSLAVDMGRLRLAQAEMQAAADSGALAGAWHLADDPDAALNDGLQFAQANSCFDSPIVLDPDADIEFGIWRPDTRTFEPTPDISNTVTDERRRANALRVTPRRLASRGTALPLLFAPVVHITSSDIQTPAVVMIHGGNRTFGIVGIDWATSNGNNALVDSYLPSLGSYQDQTPRQNAQLASNGDIDLGNADVYGDVRPGIDGSISQQPNSLITGRAAPIDTPLDYPLDPKPTDVTWQNDPKIAGNQTYTLTGSFDPNNPTAYYFKGLTSKGDSTLSITGYVTIYVDGNVDLGGTIVVNAPSGLNAPVPSQLTIDVVKANTTVDIHGTPQAYMHIYAPGSDVTIKGTSDYYGWVIGQSLYFNGVTGIHYDETRGSDFVPYTVRMVQ